jgi:hypothetical protein
MGSHQLSTLVEEGRNLSLQEARNTIYAIRELVGSSKNAQRQDQESESAKP